MFIFIETKIELTYVDFVDTLVINTIFKDSESDSENEKKKSKPSKQSSNPSGSNFFVNFF